MELPRAIIECPIPEVPQRLPISGKKGAEKLMTLGRRANYLRERVSRSSGNTEHDFSYDIKEYRAIVWTITKIMEYENLLKYGPPEN